MYYFPNLDNTTRLIMIAELERDLNGVNENSKPNRLTALPNQKGLFYIPKSIKPDFVCAYKRILRNAFERGDVESLMRNLIPNFFKEKDKNGKKIPSNIREMVAFSDFNRYYIRAILVRAIEENKAVTVYRAKQSINERQESRACLSNTYFDKITLQRMLYVIRDYRILFSENAGMPFLKPNSGLSLKLG